MPIYLIVTTKSRGSSSPYNKFLMFVAFLEMIADLLCCICLVFAMPLYASVYNICLVVTCWEMADLLALVCGVLL